MANNALVVVVLLVFRVNAGHAQLTLTMMANPVNAISAIMVPVINATSVIKLVGNVQDPIAINA